MAWEAFRDDVAATGILPSKWFGESARGGIRSVDTAEETRGMLLSDRIEMSER